MDLDCKFRFQDARPEQQLIEILRELAVSRFAWMKKG